jgi:N-acylneuraminate cytidylyltransferase
MIAWSVMAAQEAGVFDRIIVSTDDPEIASVAGTLGAEVPFLRPTELSDDYTSTGPVIAHAIGALALQNFTPEQVCCVYATAPFIRGDDILRGMEILEQSGADFAFSVTSFAFPIQRAIKIRTDGRLEMFDQTHFETRSQDLPEAYHDAGQFYWGTKDAWQTGTPIFGPGSVPVILPRHRVQDIDTPEDWETAEALLKAMVQG